MGIKWRFRLGQYACTTLTSVRAGNEGGDATAMMHMCAANRKASIDVQRKALTTAEKSGNMPYTGHKQASQKHDEKTVMPTVLADCMSVRFYSHWLRTETNTHPPPNARTYNTRVSEITRKSRASTLSGFEDFNQLTDNEAARITRWIRPHQLLQ